MRLRHDLVVQRRILYRHCPRVIGLKRLLPVVDHQMCQGSCGILDLDKKGFLAVSVRLDVRLAHFSYVFHPVGSLGYRAPIEGRHEYGLVQDGPCEVAESKGDPVSAFERAASTLVGGPIDELTVCFAVEPLCAMETKLMAHTLTAIRDRLALRATLCDLFSAHDTPRIQSQLPDVFEGEWTHRKDEGCLVITFRTSALDLPVVISGDKLGVLCEKLVEQSLFIYRGRDVRHVSHPLCVRWKHCQFLVQPLTGCTSIGRFGGCDWTVEEDYHRRPVVNLPYFEHLFQCQRDEGASKLSSLTRTCIGILLASSTCESSIKHILFPWSQFFPK